MRSNRSDQFRKVHRLLIVVAVVLIGCTTTGSFAGTPEPIGPITTNAVSTTQPPVEQVPSTTTGTGETTTTSSPTTTTSSFQLPIPPQTVLSSEDLVDRRLTTFDLFAPPPTEEFVSTIQHPAPSDVIDRSTWSAECPVEATDLAYAQVAFYGFDGAFHTGELLVHEQYVEDIVSIFEQLHAMRFPIEQMKVVSQADLELGPTGGENNTTVFTCRRSVSSSRWSRHAYGDAIDINPFHNPYVSSRAVIPEFATAYVDRNRDVPGVVGDEITAMFVDIGWGWGGNWNSVKDWMHFSATGT